MILTVNSSVVNIMEPDDDENMTVAVCFMAYISTTLDRDAEFNLTPSNMSTATIDYDFYLNTSLPVTIAAGSRGNFSVCIDFVVIGDKRVEDLETVVYEITPISEFDLVLFQPDTNFSRLIVNITDNLGIVITIIVV